MHPTQQQQSDLRDLKALILEFSEDLLILAYELLLEKGINDAERANDIVTNIFYKVWTEGDLKEIEGAAHQYLYALVRAAVAQVYPKIH